MYRLMQPSDEAAVLALWQSQHHDTEDFAKWYWNVLPVCRTFM